MGGDAILFPCDVSDDAAFPDLKNEALSAFGRVDIVMNNVGVLYSGLPHEIPTSEWRRLFDINVMSIVRSNEVFLPEMIAKGEGHIINTGSFAALFPYAYDRLPYMASKGAVIAMTEGLALYARPRGIGVTLLLPGPVMTQIGKTARRFGGSTLPPRGPGPQFAFKSAGEVGEMVADAIEKNIFFLPTDPEIYPILKARAANPEGFIAAQAEEVDKFYQT
ncbi:MAG: SDR family oxidoreductase [Caulobacterales bacterium]